MYTWQAKSKQTEIKRNMSRPESAKPVKRFGGDWCTFGSQISRYTKVRLYNSTVLPCYSDCRKMTARLAELLDKTDNIPGHIDMEMARACVSNVPKTASRWTTD